MSHPRTRVLTILGRGLRRRCPRCGIGPLFRRGIQTFDRCSECGLLFERNYGDTWMFTIITDRIPIFIGIVVLYFGWRATGWLSATLFFVLMAVPLIATISHRQGLAIALDYLSRLHLPDPSDEIHGGRRTR
ncbi:MAG TPA: DUF983 domain-containing protein [Thermoanaerobaculia bacterium]|nr:DUF983 domain-containing protein [Thermoanaerobaculia bacterium]